MRLRDLPPYVLVDHPQASDKGDPFSLPHLVNDLEKGYILKMLDKTNWHLGETAQQLGMTRKMLGDRIRKYNLEELRKP